MPLVLCEGCGRVYQRGRGSRGRFCSRHCAGKYGARLNSGYSHSKGGKRADLDNQYFRSAWEANWARYLRLLQQQGQIASWQFEPEVFEFHQIKRGSRFYTPDFRVVNANGTVEYHEVKGWMDQRSQTKLSRMAKYYPDIKVLLIEKAAYTEVARKIGRLIPGWEWNVKHSN